MQYDTNELSDNLKSDILSSKDFLSFLNKAEDLIRLALQENEIINPFFVTLSIII